ncbi:TonB-dependent receptor domain-containing protein [Brevundimonas vesicularis]|uniref:TonB-dependent receptor n=1 Tax=Brevundimonas vesicularis TaxID=41276 RepID=UPI0038D41269
MSYRTTLFSSAAALVFGLGANIVSVAPAFASETGGAVATANVGQLGGRVLDPASGDYLLNAVVRVTDAEGNSRTVTTGEGGQFRVTGLASGRARVTVQYTGYASQSVEVIIRPDAPSTIDVSLDRGHSGDVVAVEDVVVIASARDADARAIMAQRQSMNITEVLSAESYGDIGDTNPAEFLKYMPGVDTDGTNGTAISVNLRGMPSSYTTVTVNGMNLVSADANTGAGSARTFSFESMSLVGIDSIEVEKTISADVDANAPAGRINIRTKRAFNRQKPQLTVQVSGTTHENMWDSNENTGPDSGGWRGQRFLPNGQISYSGSFLNNRLGLSASLGHSNTYIEREQLTVSRNYVPTAASPDPLGITALEHSQTQRQTTRTSLNFNLDFKATDELILGLMGVVNRGSVYQASIAPKFTTGVRARGVDGDTLYDFTTLQPATANTFSIGRSNQFKVNNNMFISPTFEWARGNLLIDGYVSYSRAESYYDSPERGQITTMTSALNGRGNFSASRSNDLTKADWDIQQLSGTDWGRYDAFTLATASARPVIRTTNGSTSDVENVSGAINATWSSTPWNIPVDIKGGLKFSDTTYEFNDTSANNLYTYSGPLSNAEFLQAVQGRQQITIDSLVGSLRTLNGNSQFYTPDLGLLYDTFRDNPEQWAHTLTAANWLASRITNYGHYSEATQAAYVMATASPTQRLRLRAGLRWERTETQSREFDPHSAAAVEAAGFTVNTSGQATTIEGLEFQYLDKPMVTRKGEYDYFFPSASAKFDLDEQTVLHAGYSRTILRPEPDVLSGVVTRNDIDQIIRAPNPGLEPAISDNFSVRMERYFEPVGIISLGYYQNVVDGLFQSYEMTAEEFGNTDPELADYTFITTAKIPGEAVNIRGAEFAFNHAMDYLPGPLRHIRARGSFMYNDPDTPIVRVADKVASLSFSYNDRKLKLNLNNTWTDDKYRSTTPSWFAARLDTSLNGSYRFAKGYEFFFSISNLLDNNINIIVPGSLADGQIGDHSAINVHNGRHGKFGLRFRF